MSIDSDPCTSKSDKYKSELFEVPFVRMRGWYQEKFKTIPPSYQTLISKVQTVAPPAVNYPEIAIDAANGTVKLNGVLVSLSKTNFAALYLIAKGVPMRDLHAKLVELHNGHSDTRCDWLDTFREGSRFASIDDIDDLRKTLSELRKKFQSAGFANAESLVPQRGKPVTFPMGRIKISNGVCVIDGNADMGERDDVYNVTIRNVHARSAGGHGVIRLLVCDGIKMHHISVEDVVDTATGDARRPQATIRLGDVAYHKVRRCQMGEMHHVTVKGVKASGKVAVWMKGPMCDSSVTDITPGPGGRRYDVTAPLERVALEPDGHAR